MKRKTSALTLDEALPALRRGKPIRRRAWHPLSFIVRVGSDVFVKLPPTFQKAPTVWEPYPQDILAADWEVAHSPLTSKSPLKRSK